MTSAQYSDLLSEVIQKNTGFLPANRRFKELQLPNEIDLQEAFQLQPHVISKVKKILDGMDSKTKYIIKERPTVKNLERVIKKHQRAKERNVYRDDPVLFSKYNGHHNSWFKAHCDFIGAHIMCDHKQIGVIFDALFRNFKVCIKRNLIKDHDKWENALLFCYVWDPETKYIIELQIGHPFIIYAHDRDSAIRNQGSKSIQLWDNNFVPNVVKKILGYRPDFDVLSALQRLYGSAKIEDDLMKILTGTYLVQNLSTAKTWVEDDETVFDYCREPDVSDYLDSLCV